MRSKRREERRSRHWPPGPRRSPSQAPRPSPPPSSPTALTSTAESASRRPRPSGPSSPLGCRTVRPPRPPGEMPKPGRILMPFSWCPPDLLRDVIAPALKTVLFDRSAATRKAVLIAVASWLGEGERKRPPSPSSWRETVPPLLPLLLLGVTDPAQEVAVLSLQLLEQVLPFPLSPSSPTLFVLTAASLSRLGSASAPVQLRRGAGPRTLPRCQKRQTLGCALSLAAPRLQDPKPWSRPLTHGRASLNPPAALALGSSRGRRTGTEPSDG